MQPKKTFYSILAVDRVGPDAMKVCFMILHSEQGELVTDIHVWYKQGPCRREVNVG
jgi:hypothetical protein